MITRRQLVFLVAATFPAMGASVRTTNFLVSAPTPQIAQQIGQAAEYYRKQKAQQWLGYEMPAWGRPCPLNARVTMGAPGGATSFVFDNNQILRMEMNIEGPLDRLLASVLPHEVTHTVFAYYFRRPVPRWADEGGSVLSEDDAERDRHDRLVRQFLNEGRAFTVRNLFALRDYPPRMDQVGCMYAEGFSMSNYLVSRSDRATFLKFVAHGMQHGWDGAVQTYYRYNSVEELEQAWLAELRRTKRQPGGTMLASNTRPAAAVAAGPTLVRLTAPPVQPLAEATRPPTFRGQSGGAEGAGRFGDDPPTRPGYLPDYVPASDRRLPRQPQPVTPTGWNRPAREEPYKPVEVTLGPPEYEAPARPPAAAPNTVSPVGYPR